MNDNHSSIPNKWYLKTPVVLIIFKRWEQTQKVLEVISQVKPSQLFIIADGPRPEQPGEKEKCFATREVVENIDWECEVFRNYSEINLGTGKRISSGLDWVFDHTDRAIILEDDCVPQLSFFPFCEELLEKYQDDTRITSIAGQNFLPESPSYSYSYYFSNYSHCWGWATWKRAWNCFDFDMKLWTEVKTKNLLTKILSDPQAVNYWQEIFQRAYDNHKDTWAYPWLLSCWLQSGLSIHPRVNLVSNIGFGKEATHTFSTKSPLANLPTKAINLPLKHPPYIIRDSHRDNLLQKKVYEPKLSRKIKKQIKKVLNIS